MSESSRFTADDAHYMAQALRLAEKGQLTVRPNPAVGCVIVKHGKVVGEGWHHKAGTPHAEVHALAMAGQEAQQATAYVTLEPCSHYGRTPPCALALVNSGVSRVVCAMQDPNPLVAGKGLALLKEAGIEVSSGLMETSARALNQGFLSRMEGQRPFIRVKLATSLDGRTALANGQSQWITGEAARADVQKLRARSGAIVTGIETVLADNPSLTVRRAGFEDFQPLRVILDSQLRMPLSAHLLTLSGQVMIVTLAKTAYQQTEKVSQLTQLGVQLLVLPDNDKGRIDLSPLITYLAKEHQINDLLVEAGARLAGAFVEEDLADELWWYTAAAIMGQEARAGLITPHFQQMTDIYRWQVKDQRMIGQDQRMILEKRMEKS